MEWQIVHADGFEERYQRFYKKHRHESTAMMRNLAKYFELLKDGKNPLQIKEGFIHHKVGLGIKEIDQKGCDIPKPMQITALCLPQCRDEHASRHYGGKQN